MKMTMHIDEDLLDEVMNTFGCASKTEAVDFALKELVRKKKLRAYAKTGLGLTSEELKSAVDPDYDLMALRVAETPAQTHGKRRSSR
jgi:Arc/MetJ family transcription regulator